MEIFMTMFSWSHNRVISKIGYLWYLWYWNRPLILILTSMCAVWSAESSGKVGHVRHWWWGVPPFSPGSCTLPASLAPAASWPYTSTLSQSPCTALTAGICLPLGVCQETVNCIWKMVEILTGYMSTIHCHWGNPNLYLDQPITKSDATQLEAMSYAPLKVLLPQD